MQVPLGEAMDGAALPPHSLAALMSFRPPLTGAWDVWAEHKSSASSIQIQTTFRRQPS